jgi:hypothetical protein
MVWLKNALEIEQAKNFARLATDVHKKDAPPKIGAETVNHAYI